MNRTIVDLCYNRLISSILGCMIDVKIWVMNDGKLKIEYPLELQSMIIRNVNDMCGNYYEFNHISNKYNGNFRQFVEYSLK